MKIAFQMEPIHAVNVEKSTSYRLLAEAARRGFEIFRYSPEHLSMYSGAVVARGERLHFKNAVLDSHTETTIKLADMDVVLMRQDPPFDMSYITATYMLERIGGKTRVINNPREVRDNPEKIMPLMFPEFVPPTLISASVAEVKNFAAEHGDIVIKPLYSFGGRGVLHLKDGDGNIEPAAELLVERYGLPFIAQKYLPEVKDGDKRILLLDGEVMGAFWRRPVSGSHRANLRVGGELLPAKLSAREEALCARLGPVLREKGLSFTGIDMIGDFMTEINVTSPMGFAQLESLYGTNPAADFWDWVVNNG